MTVEVFGQRELRDLSQTTALRTFAARRVGADWTKQLEAERVVHRDLESRASDLASTEMSLRELQEVAAERDDYTERVARAKAAGVETVVARLDALGKADRGIRTAVAWPSKVRDAMQSVSTLLPPPSLPGEAGSEPFAEELQGVASVTSNAIMATTEAADAAAVIGESHRANWSRAFANERSKLEGELADLGITNPAEFAQWQTRVAELGEALLALPTAQSALDAARVDRQRLLSELGRLRRAKSRLVERSARELSDLLPARVRLRIEPLGDREPFRKALNQALVGQGVRSDQLDRLTEMGPDKVAEAITAGADGVGRLGVTATTATKLASLSSDMVRQLEIAEIQDKLVLEMDLSSDGSGEWRDVDLVSPGQRATALLALVLVGGTEPIVIDQPEDDLDNRYIYEEVVKLLARVCENRQVVVATHNANIPILGDAELVLALDATASRSRVTAIGGLEIPAVAAAARDILEGGAEAFEARSRRYLASRGV